MLMDFLLLSDPINAITAGTLLAALVLVDLAAARAHTHWGDRMGSPTWELGKSWASTFAVLGALLTIILASGALLRPATTELGATDPAVALAGLSLLFGLLALLAPALYQAIGSRAVPSEPVAPATGATSTEAARAAAKRAQWDRRMKVIDPIAPDPAPNPKAYFVGFVGGYIAACVLTVWAVLGELVTILVLLLPRLEASALTPEATWIFRVCLIGAVVLVVIYVLNTIPQVMREQSLSPNDFHVMEDGGRTVIAVNVPRQWTLL
jgi:hypothetical protein